MGNTRASFNANSPALLLQSLDAWQRECITSFKGAQFPKHWLILHGTADKTVPVSESETFASILRHDLGVRNVRLAVLRGVDHSGPIVGELD